MGGQAAPRARTTTARRAERASKTSSSGIKNRDTANSQQPERREKPDCLRPARMAEPPPARTGPPLLRALRRRPERVEQLLGALLLRHCSRAWSRRCTASPFAVCLPCCRLPLCCSSSSHHSRHQLSPPARPPDRPASVHGIALMNDAHPARVPSPTRRARRDAAGRPPRRVGPAFRGGRGRRLPGSSGQHAQCVLR